MTTSPAQFQNLVAESFEPLCKAYGLRMRRTDNFIVRLDGPKVFIHVVYDAYKTRELSGYIGQQPGVARDVERPFQLSELLRAVGQYGLPEAQLQETVVASHDDIKAALRHLADLFASHGQEALQGSRTLFSRLDAQRNVDSDRYEYNRELGNASRAAFVAWSQRQYEQVVLLLKPFRVQLTPEEANMLNTAESRLSRT